MTDERTTRASRSEEGENKFDERCFIVKVDGFATGVRLYGKPVSLRVCW